MIDREIVITGMAYALRDEYAERVGKILMKRATAIAVRDDSNARCVRVRPQHVHAAVSELLSKVIE